MMMGQRIFLMRFVAAQPRQSLPPACHCRSVARGAGWRQRPQPCGGSCASPRGSSSTAGSFVQYHRGASFVPAHNKWFLKLYSNEMLYLEHGILLYDERG